MQIPISNPLGEIRSVGIMPEIKQQPTFADLYAANRLRDAKVEEAVFDVAEKQRKQELASRIQKKLSESTSGTKTKLEAIEAMGNVYASEGMSEDAKRMFDVAKAMREASLPKTVTLGNNVVAINQEGTKAGIVPVEGMPAPAEKKPSDVLSFEYSQGLSPEQREAFIKFRSQGGRIFTGNIGNGDQMFAQDSLGNISVLNIPVNQLKGTGAPPTGAPPTGAPPTGAPSTGVPPTGAPPAGATTTTGAGTENTPGGVELPVTMDSIPIKAPLGKDGSDKGDTSEDYVYYEKLGVASAIENEKDRFEALTSLNVKYPNRERETANVLQMTPATAKAYLSDKTPIILRLGELTEKGDVSELQKLMVGKSAADQKAIGGIIDQVLRKTFPDTLTESIKNTLNIQDPKLRTVAIMQLENDNPLYSGQIRDALKNELAQQKGYATQLKIDEMRRKQEIKDPLILRDLNEKKLASAVKVLETAKPLSLEYWMAKLSEAEARRDNTLYKEAAKNIERLGTSGEASRYVTLKDRGGITADGINNAIQDEKIMLETYKFLKTTPKHVWDDFTARAQSGQTWSTMLKNLEGVTDEKSRETWKFMTRLQQYINVYGNRMYGATLTNNERDNVMKVISGDSPLVGGNEIKASLSGLLDYYKGNLQIYDADLGTDFTNTEKMDKRIGIVAPPKGIIRKGALK